MSVFWGQIFEINFCFRAVLMAIVLNLKSVSVILDLWAKVVMCLVPVTVTQNARVLLIVTIV